MKKLNLLLVLFIFSCTNKLDSCIKTQSENNFYEKNNKFLNDTVKAFPGGITEDQYLDAYAVWEKSLTAMELEVIECFNNRPFDETENIGWTDAKKVFNECGERLKENFYDKAVKFCNAKGIY